MEWKYTDQYIKIYEDSPVYGRSGRYYIRLIETIIAERNISSVFDFGCGRNANIIIHLAEKFPHLKLLGYDPAITENTKLTSNVLPNNSKFDLVISTDCLEHVPENELSQCFEIFKQVDPKYMLHVICTRAAEQTLPDGTNAHKTIKPRIWWRKKFASNFNDYSVRVMEKSELQEPKNFVRAICRRDNACVFLEKKD
jgi:trans-aconitate methyltransferase